MMNLYKGLACSSETMVDDRLFYTIFYYNTIFKSRLKSGARFEMCSTLREGRGITFATYTHTHTHTILHDAISSRDDHAKRMRRTHDALNVLQTITLDNVTLSIRA